MNREEALDLVLDFADSVRLMERATGNFNVAFTEYADLRHQLVNTICDATAAVGRVLALLDEQKYENDVLTVSQVRQAIGATSDLSAPVIKQDDQKEA